MLSHIALVLAIGSAAWQPADAGKGNQQAGAEKHGAAKAPLVVQVVRPDTEKAAAQQIAQRADVREQAHLVNESNIVYWTRWMVFVTAFLGVFTFGLFIYTRKLAADAKASGERGLRAYVHFDRNYSGTTFPQRRATNSKFALKYALRNLGRTPAYGVKVRTLLGILPEPLPASHPEPDWPNVRFDEHGVVAPDQQVTITYTANIFFDDPAWTDAVASNGVRLLMWMRIEYADTFGVPHWTTVCMNCNWNTKPVASWDFVQGRNDTDHPKRS